MCDGGQGRKPGGNLQRPEGTLAVKAAFARVVRIGEELSETLEYTPVTSVCICQ